MQISVHSAQRISLRRPVARTAARKSASSHAFMVVRSIAGSSSRRSASSGTVGPRPAATLIVECTIGTPNSLRGFTVDTMFLSSRSGSMERTAANCEGW